MKAKTRRTLRAFAIELGIYALLVTGYFFLVLHLLGGWLYGLEVHHRYTYAGAAILLIIGQIFSRWIARVAGPKADLSRFAIAPFTFSLDDRRFCDRSVFWLSHNMKAEMLR